MPGCKMNEKLGLALFLVTLLTWSQPGASPRWVEHASLPGPDTTEVGLSRFDQLLLLDQNHYWIPYPFSRLTEFLDSRIENVDHSGVRQVFVPATQYIDTHTRSRPYW
jgi:hypothetical protein